MPPKINKLINFFKKRRKLRVNPEFSSQGKKFFFFNVVSVWDDGCSLHLLWSSFHEVCKSNHYATLWTCTVLSIEIQCQLYVNKTGRKNVYHKLKLKTFYKIDLGSHFTCHFYWPFYLTYHMKLSISVYFDPCQHF